MNGRVFPDTNIFVYAIDNAPSIVTKKNRAEEALEFIHYISALETVIPNLDMVLAAIGLHQKHKFAFWDSMILQSAVVADGSLLLTEDFQDGFQLGSLTIKNPFA
jgi:predicted nucleic acid-binding protein